MIKKTILLLFSFLLLILSSDALQAKNVEVLDTAQWRIFYKVNMQTFNDGQVIVVTDTMALDIGQRWSVYYNPYRQAKDSLKRLHAFENFPRGLTFKGVQFENELRGRLRFGDLPVDTLCNRRGGETAFIYKQRLSNEVVTIDNAPEISPGIESRFRFREHIPPQNWIITSDTLSVLGYICYRATASFRGRDYTAWFTPDIPISEGPFKFYGLPGLILKLKDDTGVFHFQAIGLENLASTSIRIDLGRTVHRFSDGQRTWHAFRFVEGDLRQWHNHRKQYFGIIHIGFLDRISEEILEFRRRAGNTNTEQQMMTYFSTNNPIIYPEIEIIE